MRIKIRRNKATQSNLSFFLFLFFLVIYPLGVVSVILLNLLASETFLGSQIFSCHNVLIITFFIATFNLSHFASLNFWLLNSIFTHHFFGSPMLSIVTQQLLCRQWCPNVFAQFFGLFQVHFWFQNMEKLKGFFNFQKKINKKKI